MRDPLVWLIVLLAAACGRSHADEWPEYLGPGSSQYSPLDQITRENVHELEVAWVYHTGDADLEDRSQIQANPIIVDGVLYATSAQLKVFALDAATGEPRWTFDPFDGGYDLFGAGVNRGVTYWEDGDDRRILFTGASSLYAVDAVTGLPIESFGDGGSIDFREGLDRDIGELFIASNTPGVIYDDLLILPTRVSEGARSAPGHIRAYDVRTGERVWIFHTIPHPGEFGYDTWPDDAWQSVGGANNWAGMTVDHGRGIVYVPTGSATPDFYGGARLGANLFANTLLALDARTGERIWHYQIVHHDLWDRDLPAPPNLVTVTHGGEPREAVAQITKSAHVFLFDRETGEPLFPVEEQKVPASDLPGEVAWPTQPVPTAPPPFSRQVFTENDVTDLSPEAYAMAFERLTRVRSGGQFVPPSREGTIILPGYDGGGEWGGAAVDPDGVMYVNASEMPWILTMVALGAEQSLGETIYANECLYCHGTNWQGDPLGVYPALVDVSLRMSRQAIVGVVTNGAGLMPAHQHLSDDEIEALVDYLSDTEDEVPPVNGGVKETAASGTPATAYTSSGYIRFLDDSGNPAIKPPWGTLTAIDLHTGTIRWQVPLGELDELSEQGLLPTGTENYGGPIVSAGGVLFIGATKDEKFRAFSIDTGRLLWEINLPAGGYATPATYAVDGRQYVVIAAGGGKMGTKSGDSYVAVALPE